MTRIRIKRVYEPEAPEDGYRVLVDKIVAAGHPQGGAPL